MKEWRKEYGLVRSKGAARDWLSFCCATPLRRNSGARRLARCYPNTRRHSKFMRVHRLLLPLLTLAAPLAYAQNTPPVYPPAVPSALDSATQAPDLHDAKAFANPSVLGMGPSKGLIVRYERMPNFRVNSTAQVVGLSDYRSEARKNARLSIKGYIPAWNRPHLKVIVGLSYEREEFKFRNPATGYQLYDNIENKGLKSTAAQLAVIRPVDETH